MAAAGSRFAACSVQPFGDLHTFVACPVYRDTNQGRKSGCWLATENQRDCALISARAAPSRNWAMRY